MLTLHLIERLGGYMTTTSVAERDSFGWVFRVLGSGLTALALVALMRPAFVKWTLSAPMQLLMDAYNTTIQVLLGWTEPYLGAAVAWLNGLVGWHVALSPIWRDAFVITTPRLSVAKGCPPDVDYCSLVLQP